MPIKMTHVSWLENIAVIVLDGAAILRGAHVVLAVTEIERGTVARTLDRMGVNREDLAAAAREELATPI